MQAHHAVVDSLVQGTAVGVHHVQLPPQIIPVLLPAILLSHPARHASTEPLLARHRHCMLEMSGDLINY